MDVKWKRYLTFHVSLLLIAVGFAVYALLTRFLFPNGFFHCVVYDLLHLYCPFCGGTRAFLALLKGDVLTALRMNAPILVAALACLVLDVRALLLLCRKSDKRLIPPHLGQIAVIYFLLCTLLRNIAMLYGLDPAGDRIVFWQNVLAPWRVALFLPMALLISLTFLVAIDLFPAKRLARFRVPAAWASGYLLIALLCVLYARWFVFLLFVPLTLGLGIFYFIRYKKRKS